MQMTQQQQHHIHPVKLTRTRACADYVSMLSALHSMVAPYYSFVA